MYGKNLCVECGYEWDPNDSMTCPLCGGGRDMEVSYKENNSLGLPCDDPEFQEGFVEPPVAEDLKTGHNITPEMVQRVYDEPMQCCYNCCYGDPETGECCKPHCVMFD